MGLFQSIFSKNKRSNARQNSRRMEYLLNENTPFNVSEAFRDLKVQLSVSVPKAKGGTTLLVTSSYPTEGKTTITSNLALMFAFSNAKVVLVDADIRKGRIHKYFGSKSTPGLSDCLSGLNTLDEVIHPSGVAPNLSYIPCGIHSPRPFELLESEQMKEILKELREKFDYVIIDTSPILVISDALALVSDVDGVVVVSRHQETYLSDLNRSLKLLCSTKANVLGVVVNDYDDRASTASHGKYKQYYYYEYSNKEQAPEVPPSEEK